ncbi:hypothetical protein MMC18_002843 [Xylographa bjoerkii]|nr:hypothetical protein [Xylographa bjoerkii]
MPKAKAISSLSGMIDSDMDELSDVEMMPTPDSNQENTEPAKKPPGRPKAATTKVRKTKAASRRLSGGPKPKAAAKKKEPARRAALKEQTNEEQASDIEEVDDFVDEAQGPVVHQEAEPPSESLDIQVDTKKKPGRKPKAAAKGKQTAKKDVLNPVKVVEKDGEFEYTPTATRQNKLASKASVATKNVTTKPQPSDQMDEDEKTIPETQPPPLDTDEFDLPQEDEEEPIPQSVYRQVRNARSNSKQPQPNVARRRAGSASDTERGGTDPATRRKLGEMTKKFENLDMKYRSLREVGVKEAEANFEKLKKQSEERTKTANDLIASLRKELATQKSLALEAKTIRTTLTSTEASLSTAQSRISELSASLLVVQNENKALSAKLAASRSASTTIESTSTHAKTPGSAMKGKGTGTRTIMVGSAEAAQAAQVAQLKEELYADLTGLLLRGVDRMEDVDVYDCIQTGRNGSMFSPIQILDSLCPVSSVYISRMLISYQALHFKLAVATDTSATVSYEETEFTYTPRLDSNRDRDLLDILPDYLTEEITFSRQNAAKFYSRVVETLTKQMRE